MAESMFDIFGSHIAKPQESNKNKLRKAVGNVENFGKVFASDSGPLKTFEPSAKKTDSKKSFLSNKGAAIQLTPRQMFASPRHPMQNVNKQQPLQIYSDTLTQTAVKNAKVETDALQEILEFKRNPTTNYDNYYRDLFDLYDPIEEYADDLFPCSDDEPEFKSKHFCYDMESHLTQIDDIFNDEISLDEGIECDYEDLEIPSYY